MLENVLQSNDSPTKKAFSIALGVFIGIAPFWGFQTAIVLGLALLFKLNKVIAFAFSNISIPPFIPFVIYGSLKVGSYFITAKTPLLLDKNITFNDIQDNITQYLVGSFVLATFLAAIFGMVSYFLFLFLNTFKNKK